MAVVPYINKVARNVRGTSVSVGQELYAVQQNGLFFIWSYANRAFAEAMDFKLTPGPKDAVDISANWRKSVYDLVPSGRTSF